MAGIPDGNEDLGREKDPIEVMCSLSPGRAVIGLCWVLVDHLGGPVRSDTEVEVDSCPWLPAFL